MGGVDVLSWNPVRTEEGAAGERLVDNFGDLLGPVLVERIAGSWALKSPDRSGPTPILVSVGSVMHFAPYHAVVWGSGANFKVTRPVPITAPTLDVRAVRGPLTARTLAAAGISVPRVYGDPALLLPRFMPELGAWSRLRGDEVLVVPNLNDYSSVAPMAEQIGLAVLNPQAPLSHVLRTIAQSGLVIGSSLHAVVVADSLGVPARFVASESEHPFKYRDYLAGTGRPLTRVAPDLASAIEMGGHAPLDIDLEPLLAAFPHDMWGGEPPSADRTDEFVERESILAAWAEVMATNPPSTDRVTESFIERLAELVQRGSEVVDDAGGAADEMVSSAFQDRFDEVRAHREALASELTAEMLEPRLASALAALDSGKPALLLRSIWLSRVGPHALIRTSRVGPLGTTLSLAVRPGGLANTLSSLRIRLRSFDDEVQEHGVAFFAQYTRQWSVDLSLGLSEVQLPAGGSWLCEVVLTDADGVSATLPVLDAGATAASLSTYPDLAESRPWVLSTSPAVARQSGEGAA